MVRVPREGSEKVAGVRVWQLIKSRLSTSDYVHHPYPPLSIQMSLSATTLLLVDITLNFTMPQSDIKSFFAAVAEPQYESQLQRDREEHAVEREAAEIERVRQRSRIIQRREASHSRRRKQRVVNNNIVVKNIAHSTTTITIHIDDDHGSSPSSSPVTLPPAIPSNDTLSSLSPTSSTLTSSTSSSMSDSTPSVKRSRTDWLANPALVNIIDAAVQSSRSYTRAVKALQQDAKTAATFHDLTESTVRTWYMPRSFEMKAAVLERLGGGKKGRTGRPSVLTEHPEVEEYVIDAIVNIRAASGTINSIVISSFFRGFIAAKCPDLMKECSFSRRWCRKWFAHHFSWTYKKATTSGQKLPVDWEEKVARMVKRVSGTAAQHNIVHPCFIINWDQTGVVLMQASKYTYHDIKSKQVPVAGQDDKRQITAVVASTLDGDLLPLQLIFKGQDRNKQQQKAVPALGEVDTKRTRGWHLTQTNNHWSSLDSMKDYIRGIVRPWVEQKGKELGVVSPHCVLLLDCWSVHKSKEFITWMAKAYPRYHLVFVPAGCTGKAQPADVGLQRPFKCGIVNAFTSWMSNEIHLLVKGGAAPAEVKVDTGLVKLKPWLVRWTWQSWDKLRRNRDMIKQGWDRCGLSQVLDKAQQVEAMRFCISQPAEADVLGEEEEDACVDVSDGEAGGDSTDTD
jgi:hypothetical protein